MRLGHIEDQLDAIRSQNPDTFDSCPETTVDQHVAVPRYRATKQASDNRCPRPVVDSDGFGHLKARCHARAILRW
jgi:hypothetical protein